MRHLTMILGGLLGGRSRVAGMLLGAGGGYVLGLLLEARPGRGHPRSLPGTGEEPIEAPRPVAERYPEEALVDALRGDT